MSCEQNNTEPPQDRLDLPEAHFVYEIHWGGFVFRFKTAEEARADGFQI